MKNNFLIAFLTIFSFAAFISCNKNQELDHLKVSPVETLFSPANNKFIKLDPKAGTQTFEWQQARAEDGGLVMYEVLFDKENGDFSQPIYSSPSDDNGAATRLTLTDAQLNKIAEAAGINPTNTGKIKWTVWASKGINVEKGTATSVLELERPAGFTEIPSELYLTGSATEAGADLSKAIKMKKLSTTSYEIITSLKDGEYFFVDRNTGTPIKFSNNNGNIVVDGTTNVTGTKVYRIVVDFEKITVDVKEIKRLEYFFAPDDKYIQMTYTGNSIYKLTTTVTFKQESWGRDERYKFMMVFNNNGEDEFLRLSSANRDNQRPTSSSPLSYWEFGSYDPDRWNYTFKFATEVDGKEVDIIADFSPSLEKYTHKVIIK